jgi:hypothetical protein
MLNLKKPMLPILMEFPWNGEEYAKCLMCKIAVSRAERERKKLGGGSARYYIGGGG